MNKSERTKEEAVSDYKWWAAKTERGGERGRKVGRREGVVRQNLDKKFRIVYVNKERGKENMTLKQR